MKLTFFNYLPFTQYHFNQRIIPKKTALKTINRLIWSTKIKIMLLNMFYEHFFFKMFGWYF